MPDQASEGVKEPEADFVKEKCVFTSKRREQGEVQEVKLSGCYL